MPKNNKKNSFTKTIKAGTLSTKSELIIDYHMSSNNEGKSTISRDICKKCTCLPNDWCEIQSKLAKHCKNGK